MKALNSVGEYIVVDYDYDLDAECTQILLEDHRLDGLVAVYYKDGQVVDSLGSILVQSNEEAFEILRDHGFPVDRVSVLRV